MRRPMSTTTHREPVLRTGRIGGAIAKAVGGLHYIRGNRLPYFSLTLDSNDHCGAGSDMIPIIWPDLAPLAALHLSDINGQPMHAESNGWYWMAGALGGARQQYHGGNGSPAKSPDECLRVFASLMRIDLDQAHAMRAELQAAPLSMGPYTRAWTDAPATSQRALLDEWVKGEAQRWKAEADAAIMQFDLQVYGDPWTEERAAA